MCDAIWQRREPESANMPACPRATAAVCALRWAATSRGSNVCPALYILASVLTQTRSSFYSIENYVFGTYFKQHNIASARLQVADYWTCVMCYSSRGTHSRGATDRLSVAACLPSSGVCRGGSPRPADSKHNKTVSRLYKT